MARAIANEIRVRVTPEESARLARTRTVRPEAYEAYLLGRHHLNRFASESFSKAIGSFQLALEMDPAYAAAHAGLAETYVNLAFLGGPSLGDCYARGREAALRALELDETLAEAHAAIGWVKMVSDWDWPGAEQEFRRAAELNPSSVTARYFLSVFLSALHRHEDAIAEAQRAFDLDPLSPLMVTNLGWGYLGARQLDRAAGQFRKALAMDPSFGAVRTNLAEVYLLQGSFDQALAELQQLGAGEPFAQALRGRVYAAAGRSGEARQILEELKKQSRESYVPPFSIAALCVAVDDREQALEWLEKSVANREAWLIFLKWSPGFDPLHSDRRFQDLLRRMNFPGKRRVEIFRGNPMTPLQTLGLVLGASYASGLNLYATVAVLGLLHRYHVVQLPPQLDVLAHPLVLGAALVLYLIEFVADKIPYVDNAWDVLHTFIRPPAAAVLAYTAVGSVPEAWRWTAALVAGSVALASHGTKASTRAAVNTSPEPVSNWLLSLSEDGVAVFLAWLAATHPLLTIALVLAFLVVSVYVVVKLFGFLRRAVRRLRRGPGAPQPAPPV